MGGIVRLGGFVALFCVVGPIWSGSERIVVGWNPLPAQGARRHTVRFTSSVIAEAARREGIELEWRTVRNFREVDQALDQRWISLFPAAIPTPQRHARYYLSDPWWDEDLALLARADGPATEDALAGMRIALASAIAAEPARRAFPQSIIVEPDAAHEGAVTAASVVCRGDADAALMTHRDVDETITANWPKECAGVKVSVIDTGLTVGIALMTRPADAPLARRLRKRIDEMAGDGTLARIAAQHPGIPSSSATALAERIRQRSHQRSLWMAVCTLLAIAAAGIAFLLRMRTIQQRLRRDVAARAEAENALRESEQRFRALVENASDAFFVHDENGRLVDVNRQACESLGYSREELLNLNIAGIETDTDASHEPWKQIVPGGGRTLSGHHRRSDGTSFPVEARLSTYTVAGRRLYLRLVRDITERKRAEEALQRSNDELQAYAYTVSHDLQEPIRTVVSYADLLAQRYSDRLEDDAREFIQVIRTGALRMTTMLQDLLQYSRAGQDAAAPASTVDMNAAARNALYTLERKLSERQAQVIVGPLPVVRAWEGRFEQVFQNLIENALKYSRPEEQPRIEIGAEAVNGHWRFSVADNGIGLDMRYAHKVFRVFQRLHGREKYSGNGIGLAISKRIIERHGGRIWVDWSEPGHGTRFCFTVPSAKPE
jgi:PAS domain S-box-containing protein